MRKILPQNYRKITAKSREHFEKHSGKYFKFIFGFEVFLTVVLIASVGFLFLKYKNVQKERVGELKRLVFWEQQTVKFGNYPEAYYNAAVHAARLGDNEKALEYLDKSLEINPHYEPAKNLRDKLTL
jgi:hypothetical protein